jgi:hypothetical protein
MPEYHQGKYQPQNPQKYIGDTTNIVYRSGWELRVMQWLDENPDVERWGSEELTIPYRSPIDHQIRRYIPDFVVKFRSPTGSQIALLEIKPESQTKPPKQTKRKRRTTLIYEAQEYAVNQAKWESARQFCENRGWKFMVLTEKNLPVITHK